MPLTPDFVAHPEAPFASAHLPPVDALRRG